MSDVPNGRLDTVTLDLLARRARSHWLVAGATYRPSSQSPRRLELELSTDIYPRSISEARFDVRWFDTGDYSVHYVETADDEVAYQCRWDRHPKTDAPRSHFHPPPDAGAPLASPIESNHPLDVLFSVLRRADDRLDELQDG